MNKSIKKILVPIRNTARSPISLFLRNYTEILKPKTLVFMPTDRCNSHCKHCNIWRQKPTPNPLTLKEIEKTLSDPLFKDVRGIINTGGEPVIREDIKEIFLIEHKVFPKAKLQLSTNGILAERVTDLVRFLLKKDIPIDVGVSLDGVGEKHNFIRGTKGNFERVDWLLNELVKLRNIYKDKLSVVIGFTLSDLTVDNLEELKKYGEKLNIEVFVQSFNQAPFYSNIGEKLMTNNKVIKIVESLPSSFGKEMWLNALKGTPIRFYCFALYTFCVLNCNGDIIPCLNHFDKPIGNVREKTPTEIWHSVEAKKIRKIVKKCPGCLNSWGAGWSFSFCAFPILKFYFTRFIKK